MSAARYFLAFFGLSLAAAPIASAQSFSYGHTLSVDSAAAPYLVSLTVPAGVDIANISDAGHYDAKSNRILWGPFDQTGAQELSFDVISSSSTAIAATPQIITTGSVVNGAAPSVAGGSTTFASWAAGQAPGATSALRKSASFDLNSDGLPNLIAYLLDLPMDGSGDLWEVIDLEATTGGGQRLTFSDLPDAPDYDLLLQEIDLDSFGGITRVINLSEMGASPQLDDLDAQFFFRLSSERKNP